MKRLYAICLVILFPAYLMAAPSVAGIEGTVASGEAIVISGSAFGSGATVYKWDNFEQTGGDYDVGDSIANGWSLNDTGSRDPVYTASNQRTGSTKSAYGSTGTQDLTYDNNDTMGEIYVTWWWRRTLAADLSTWNSKPAVISYNYMSSYPTFFIFDELSAGETDIYATSSIKDAYNPGTAHTLADDDLGTIGEEIPSSNEWVRYEVWCKESSSTEGVFNGTADGFGKIWLSREGETTRTLADMVNTLTADEGGSEHWDNVSFMCWVASGVSSPQWVDDVYIASSPARVEIGDASTWAACTHREIQIPTAWATGEITATINRGSFGATDTAYLYVVDADGAVNSSGYEITFGDTEAGSPAPPTLSNVTISNGSFR